MGSAVEDTLDPHDGSLSTSQQRGPIAQLLQQTPQAGPRLAIAGLCGYEIGQFEARLTISARAGRGRRFRSII